MVDLDGTCGLLDAPTMPKKPPPKPEPEPRPTALAIKGSPGWRAWVQRVAKHCRTDTSKLVDSAIEEYAKKRGFTEPPPER